MRWKLLRPFEATRTGLIGGNCGGVGHGTRLGTDQADLDGVAPTVGVEPEPSLVIVDQYTRRQGRAARQGREEALGKA
jgi:hypothetical protein